MYDDWVNGWESANAVAISFFPPGARIDTNAGDFAGSRYTMPETLRIGNGACVGKTSSPASRRCRSLLDVERRRGQEVVIDKVSNIS